MPSKLRADQLIFVLKEAYEIYTEMHPRIPRDPVLAKKFLIERCRMWERYLEEFTWDHVRYSFKEHFKKGKFFPKPAEIIEIIRMMQEREERENRRKKDDEYLSAIRIEDKSEEWTPEEKEKALAEIHGFLRNSKNSFSRRPQSEIQKLMAEGKKEEAQKLLSISLKKF